MPLIEATQLCRDYQIPQPAQGWAGQLARLWRPRHEVRRSVDRIDFRIERGECVGLIGPNGAGKSTTIKMLTGILAPSSGSLRVAQFDPHRQRHEYVQRIGVVFGQRSQLWWDLPVRDAYRILQAIYAVPQATFDARVALFESRVGLGELLARPVRTLSLGQRMLCEIAAAFLHAPDVVFLDEPTIGLDIEMKAKIRELIATLNREAGTTVLITSHDVGDIDRLCARILLIDHGRLRFDGTLEAFKREMGSGQWWQVQLPAPQHEAALALLAAHHPHLAARRHPRGVEAAQSHIGFAELVALLGPLGVESVLAVEPDLESILHDYYRHGRGVPA
ncbi:ATP-binding cassette domain-containing protein [Chitiniphilus purpureus]|uniref:ATP-binding cassette domain-containing protein n=1 Tax=Chitiniphilus purpureus TaxID=2981137 RepID=A0ABY6DQU3_9NEIS|nr:ATP-binding cassette domain-containing protein [Chitiniphilus sp. CD1]UXY15456.1 ATP-binding cassette domain-containing protein [Chitiniphilus sp. CD1]